MENNEIENIDALDLFAKFIERINEIETEDELNGLRNVVESLPVNRELIKEMKQDFKIAQLTRDDVILLKRRTLSIFDGVDEEDTSKLKGLDKQKNELTFIYKTCLKELFDAIIIGYEREIIDVTFELCREGAKVPTYAHEGDAGFDFYVPEDTVINPGETKIVPSGLKMRIPMGYELQVRPRSGMSVKTKLRIANAPGSVDNGFSQEIGIICDNIGTEPIEIKAGDRIAQGVLNEVPRANFIQIKNIEELMKNEDRGGGFGSTGK